MSDRPQIFNMAVGLVLRVQDRKRKQPTLGATAARTTPYDANNPKVIRLTALLVDMLCKEALSFDLVDSPSFQAFVHELDPRYVIPGRKVVSRTLIPARYDKTKSEKKARMSRSKAKAVTTDMWTSASNTSYMGVTAHWIEEDFSMQSACLAVKPAPGSHTADYIAEEMQAVLNDWSIDSSSLHVVTDSGANVKKAMSKLPAVHWRACFAHTLQLCVNAGLASREVTELPKVLSKARAIVGHFRRSPLATSELEKAQVQLGLPCHKLLQDCQTR